MSQSNHSLIDELKGYAHDLSLPRHVRVAIDAAITTIMGDAAYRKDEEMQDAVANPSPTNSSEIRDNEGDTVINYNYFKGRGDNSLVVNPQQGVKRMIGYAIIPMEEYEQLTKPVSVSLEGCASAVSDLQVIAKSYCDEIAKAILEELKRQGVRIEYD